MRLATFRMTLESSTNMQRFISRTFSFFVGTASIRAIAYGNYADEVNKQETR
jgi:hypothetical protein